MDIILHDVDATGETICQPMCVDSQSQYWSVMILEPVQTKVSGIWLLEDSQPNV